MDRFLKPREWILSRYKITQAELEEFLSENSNLIFDIDGQQIINIGKKAFREFTKDKKLSKVLTPENSKYSELERKAIEADLKAKIHKAEIKKIQAEREGMILKKQRNELIDHSTAKYYYMSYLEKINLEMFRCDKKLLEYLTLELQNKLSSEELHNLTTEFKKIFENEISTTLKSIQTQQQKEVEECK